MKNILILLSLLILLTTNTYSQDYSHLYSTGSVMEVDRCASAWLIKRFVDGEKQRLALARALVKESGILLLDEPFSSLDPVLKKELLEQTRNIIAGITCIYVTHDWAEAVFMANRIATMNAGQIDQICSAADFTKQFIQDNYLCNERTSENRNVNKQS